MKSRKKLLNEEQRIPEEIFGGIPESVPEKISAGIPKGVLDSWILNNPKRGGVPGEIPGRILESIPADILEGIHAGILEGISGGISQRTHGRIQEETPGKIAGKIAMGTPGVISEESPWEIPKGTMEETQGELSLMNTRILRKSWKEYLGESRENNFEGSQLEPVSESQKKFLKDSQGESWTTSRKKNPWRPSWESKKNILGESWNKFEDIPRRNTWRNPQKTLLTRTLHFELNQTIHRKLTKFVRTVNNKTTKRKRLT